MRLLRAASSRSRQVQITEEARGICSKDDELRAWRAIPEILREVHMPEIAKNREHVHVAMEMIRIHEQMRRGQLSETAAKTQVSDVALASLMRQTPNAPKPPESIIEELD